MRKRGRRQEAFPFVSLAYASGYLVKVSAIGLAPCRSVRHPTGMAESRKLSWSAGRVWSRFRSAAAAIDLGFLTLRRSLDGRLQARHGRCRGIMGCSDRAANSPRALVDWRDLTARCGVDCDSRDGVELWGMRHVLGSKSVFDSLCRRRVACDAAVCAGAGFGSTGDDCATACTFALGCQRFGKFVQGSCRLVSEDGGGGGDQGSVVSRMARV